jgi:hypothetical protein
MKTEFLTKHRITSQVVLYTNLIAFLWMTYELTQWIMGFRPAEFSDVQYMAAVGTPTALLGFYGKLVKDMYKDYMEHGQRHLQNETNEIPKCPTCEREHKT